MKLPADVAALVDQAADRHNVPRELARAVAWVESNGDTRATSPRGAMGVMQLMPGTARTLGVRDPYDAAQNVDGGVRLLRRLLDRFGSTDRALAAYNWGPGNVARGGKWPASVHGYVAKVRATMGHRPVVAVPSQPQIVRTKPSRQTLNSAGVALAFVVVGILNLAGAVIALREYTALDGRT